MVCRDAGYHGGVVYEGDKLSRSKAWLVKVHNLHCDPFADSIYNCTTKVVEVEKEIMPPGRRRRRRQRSGLANSNNNYRAKRSILNSYLEAETETEDYDEKFNVRPKRRRSHRGEIFTETEYQYITLAQTYNSKETTCQNLIAPWVSCFKLRLVDSKKSLSSPSSIDPKDPTIEGRLEIFDPLTNDKKWKTICNRNFGQHEANLACRHLGYNWGELISSNDFIPVKDFQSTDNIAFEFIDCDDIDPKDNWPLKIENLGGCGIFDNWGNHSCSHYEDVGVRCSV